MSGTSGIGNTSEPFNVQVDRWINRAGAQMDAVYDATVHDALARLKQLTPVKTGYLRANWIAVDASGVTATPSSGESDSDGSLGFTISDARGSRNVVITNPVRYAARINYGFVGKDSLGRNYHQHGVHMVEQVIAELPQIAANACRRITEGGAQ